MDETAARRSVPLRSIVEDSEMSQYNSGQWDDGPGYDAKPIGARVVRHTSKEPWLGVFISDRLWGKLTHWTGRQTQPCIGDGCLRCAAGVRVLWKGWAYVALEHPVEQQVILEFTAAAAAVLKLYAEAHGGLSGVTFKVSRKKGLAKGLQTIAFGERRPAPLPWPNMDIVPILDRMFAGNARSLHGTGWTSIGDEIAEAM